MCTKRLERVLENWPERNGQKSRPARPQPFRRAERTPVREHGKMARTPLVTFFSIPFRPIE